MGELNFDYNSIAEAETGMRGKVLSQVSTFFSGAAPAAQAAAALNGGYLTTAAILAMVADIATAADKLTQYTNEHAELLRTSAERLRLNDETIVAANFNVPQGEAGGA